MLDAEGDTPQHLHAALGKDDDTSPRHAGVSGIASAHHGTGNVKSLGKDHLLLVPLGD